jgi:hypothetical protein
MSQIHLTKSRSVVRLVILASFASCLAPLNAQDVPRLEFSAETLVQLSEAYQDLRRQDPALEDKTADAIAEDVRTISQVWRGRGPSTEQATATGVHGSVTTAVRCDAGYVRQGEYSISDRTVAVSSEELIECDSLGCRSYEVTAISESAEPFDLDVSVDCSG